MTAEDSERLLLITLSNIGDLVMTTPVLEALHGAFPTALIDLVGDSRSIDLLAACPYAGRIIYKHKRDGWSGFFRFVRDLRRTEYRVIVDLRTKILPFLLRAETAVSKATAGIEAGHAVEQHFSAIRKLAFAPARIPATRLWTDEAADARADAVLAPLPPGAWLALAPGANWPGKVWPRQRFSDLIGIVQADYTGVMLLGSKDDCGAAAQIAQASPLPTVNLAGQTSLTAATACLARASVFVGNDSGLGHMAGAMGVPTLTVFGIGEPTRYRPWGAHSEIVLAAGADLRRLEAEAVAEALRGHLRRQHSKSVRAAP